MRQGTVRAIETGGWAVGLGVLEYVTTSTDVEHWLDQLVPHPLVPLVAIVLAGAALSVRVYRHGNATSEPAINLAEPAPVIPSDGMLAAPGPATTLVAPAATPPAAEPATGAASVTQLPELRDQAAVQAVSRSLQVPPAEPIEPPTSFIPLPTL